MSPWPSDENVDEALAVDRQLHCPADFRVVERRRLAIDEQVDRYRRLRQLADRVGHLALDVAHRLHRDLVGKAHVELAGDKSERLGRAVRNDGPLDAVEIGPAGLPVIRVLGEPDIIVRLELDEFERARADRMRAHIARRHVAGVNRRHAGREQHQERRLRALQHKSYTVIAIGRDLVEVAIPGLARIEAKLLARFAEQHVPGAFDVVRGERLAVVPFDALAQPKADPRKVLVPLPALGQLGLDQIEPVLLLVLIEEHEIVEHAHERRHRRDRRLLVDRSARRAVAVKKFQHAAALLREGRSGREQKNGARQCERTGDTRHDLPLRCRRASIARNHLCNHWSRAGCCPLPWPAAKHALGARL